MTDGPPQLSFSDKRKREKKRLVDEKVQRSAKEQAQGPHSRGLPPILTLGHLAYLTGTQYRYIRQVVSRKRDPYKAFSVDKRKGGFRVVVIPEHPLMAVQRWITKYLLNHVNPHERSFAFAPRTSILQCAQEHCGCRWLLKFDVRRFFESISEDQVYRVFRRMGYQPLISFELARICTRERLPLRVQQHARWQYDASKYSEIPCYQTDISGHLPQGAPTSPMLANLTSYRLDCTLQNLAEKHGMVYSRYADDIALSTKRRDFSRRNVGKIIGRVYSILRKYRLQPHTAKTHVSPPGARKIVLGLLVDRERPRLTRDFRERLERHLWGTQKHGLESHAAYIGFKSPFSFYNHFMGLVSFAKQVDPNWADKFKDTQAMLDDMASP